MTSIFLRFVNMSIAASWLVLVVVLLRYSVKKGWEIPDDADQYEGEKLLCLMQENEELQYFRIR